MDGGGRGGDGGAGSATSEAPSLADLERRIHHMRGDIDQLHESLEARGVNSRRVQSVVHGEVFDLPVDAEHKAVQLKILSIANPHMRAFHASWFGFFSTFFSTFAPAPLAPMFKSEATLNLQRADLVAGNLCSVSSNIVMRFVMGVVCDKLGARRGLAFLLLATSPAILGMMFVDSAAGFILCRFVIGMSLASFVACQVWCTQQFSKSIVGVANATAGGWGNLGGGITNLTMPFVFLAFMSATGENELTSLRLCFLVPLALHLVSAAFVMTGRDLPDGNYATLEARGSKQKADAAVVTKVGLSNVNAWILTLTYGFCFGVELTVTNVAAQFFFEYHALNRTTAGVLASTFGLINLFARSLGGLFSDWANARAGMRGRIWALWFWQTLSGLICMFIGLVTTSLAAPDFTRPPSVAGWAKISGWVQPTAAGWVSVADGGAAAQWVPYNASLGGLVLPCGARQVKITSDDLSSLDPRFAGLKTAVLSEPPSPWGNGDDCISNSGTLGLVVLLLVLFSICVQMAEGLTYGIVPSVSRPALGVVSGMVGAGGNAGSLITNAAFFSSDAVRSDSGLVYMGITIMATTATLFFMYFPEHGGMFHKAGALKYDPQCIKPPAGYRGSDAMDYSAKSTETSTDKAVAAAMSSV